AARAPPGTQRIAAQPVVAPPQHLVFPVEVFAAERLEAHGEQILFEGAPGVARSGVNVGVVQAVALVAGGAAGGGEGTPAPPPGAPSPSHCRRGTRWRHGPSRSLSSRGRASGSRSGRARCPPCAPCR